MEESNRDEKISMLSRQAHAHLQKNEHEAALILYHECLEILNPGDDDEKRAMIYNNMGLIHVRNAYFNRAMESFENACRLYRLLGDKAGQANQLQNIGSVYRDIRDYDKAVEMYLKALSYFEETGNKLRIADQYSNIAYIHAVSGDVKTAVSWYTLAMNLYDALNETEKAGYARVNIQAMTADMGKREGV